MSSKSFELNDCLKYSLEGIALADPTLSLIAEDNILFRKTDKDKVAIISGGGSGHEPTHAGYIGRGMLAAAVAGDIFASPSTKQILNAIKIVSQNSSGVLLVVKNYTGDVLHFGLAAERARALGIDCRVVTVGDDVAVGRSKGGHVGRRALAGTVLVHKIVGAFAEEFSARYKLEGVEKVAHIVNKNLVTVGTSLSHCKVPGRKFDSHLGDEQLELGMGIHNEPGVEVLEPIPSSEELIEKYLLPKLLDPNDDERHFVDFKASDEIVLLVNNLGGVSNFMISAIAARTKEALYEGYGITAVKVLHGTLMTAFNGNGFSITLLNVTQCNRQLHEEFTEIDSVLSLLDAPTDAAAWPASHSKKEERPAVDRSLLESFGDSRPAGKFNFELFSVILNAGAAQVIKSEPHITHLDSLVGDGDCGHTLVSGMNAVLENLPRLKRDSLSQTLVQISTCIEESMGGTSGGLYSILISGLARGLIDVCKNPNDEVTADLFAKALKIALDTLYKYTGARPGDSTMIDALAPFVTQFYKENDFESAVKACEDGARSTAKLEAKFGRASYVGDSMDIPDPGAIGIMEFLKGVKDGLDENLL